MTIEIEYIEGQQSFWIEGKLKAAQWWALADMLLFWGDFDRRMGSCMVGNSYNEFINLSEGGPSVFGKYGASASAGDMGFVSGSMKLPIRMKKHSKTGQETADGDIDRLRAILELATKDPLVAVEFSTVKPLTGQQAKRFNWHRQYTLDKCTQFCFDGRSEHRAWVKYVVLKEDVSSLMNFRGIESARREEAKTSEGIFIRKVLIPRELPTLRKIDELEAGKKCPFYVMFDPADGNSPDDDDVRLFETEDKLRTFLTELLEQPNRKVIRTGKLPVYYEW